MGGRTLFDKLCLETVEMHLEGPYSTYRLRKSLVLTNKLNVQEKFHNKNIKVGFVKNININIYRNLIRGAYKGGGGWKF